jgi:type IV pilus assembly protein PilO
MNVNTIIERLSKVPRTQRMVLYGVLVVILAVAFWLLVYLPTGDKLDQLEAKQVELKADKSAVDERVKNAEQFRTELDQLNEDLKQALKELPNDREIPGLLKGISTLGKKAGLEVRRFQPLPEEKREYVAAVPVSLEVSGSFHEVAMFFDRLSKMNRIVYVQNIEIGDPQERGGKVFLTVEGNAVTFRFLKDDERASVGKSKGKRGRKRAKGGN